MSFSGSLAQDRTKFLSANDETCMVRPTPINLNPVELKYHPFTISLYKCNVQSRKICVQKKKRHKPFKYLISANKKEAKTMQIE